MESATITIGELRAEDVAEACDLWYAIPELGVCRTFDTYERIGAFILRNPGFSSVARAEGQLVGATLCGHDGRRGFFYHTGVAPEFREQGIGTRMVERSVAQLRNAGITSAFLFTYQKDKRTQAFWHANRWEHCPWVQYQYRDL